VLRSWALRAGTGAAALAAVGSSPAVSQPPARHATVSVAIENMQFTPLRVRPSVTGSWVNKDLFPHTVTATHKALIRAAYAGGSWTYVAAKSGESPVHAYHPTMKGSLKVQ
jgi:plastocyanin